MSNFARRFARENNGETRHPRVSVFRYYEVVRNITSLAAKGNRIVIQRLRLLSIALTLFIACTLPAFAHPLGNFTINHLSKIEPSNERIALRYVLDIAEIPTFAIARERSTDGKLSPAQLHLWAQDQAKVLAPLLHLSVDGRPLALEKDSAAAHTRPGAGGLATLYLALRFHAAANLAGANHRIAFEDATYPGRLGWKDVVVAPATEPTRELTVYPSALLGSPRDTHAVAFDRSPNGAIALQPDAAAAAATISAPSAARSNQLSDMLARGTTSPLFVFLTFLVAIGLGALHALEPGHGKTLLAVSLVGARATPRQAFILAGSLTFAHTVGVLLLGVALLFAARWIVPETVYPWITLLSGAVITVLGARAMARFVRSRRPYQHAHTHDHDHAHPHAHAHDHHHPHEHHHQPHAHEHLSDDELAHARSHAIPGDAPLSFRSVVFAAMTGNVAPCPAALVVLLTALSLHQVMYGILVIIAFSFGLAGTLTGLGIAVVRGASWLSQRPQFDRFAKFGPLASAAVIALIGSVMVGQGFVAQGIHVSALLVTALSLLAIAGYVFAPTHTHSTAQTA